MELSQTENLLKTFDEIVSKLKKYDFEVEERRGVSDTYYYFIGCSIRGNKKMGNWVFTGSGVHDFIERAELFLTGYEMGMLH